MSSTPKPPARFQLHSAALHLHDCRTRLPFRFGVHTLTIAPLALLKIEARIDDAIAIGYSSDLLVPKWFEKDAAKTPRQDVLRLIESAEHAIASATHDEVPSCFDFALDAETAARARSTMPPLLAGFGPALLERAAIDAVCRAKSLPFHEALNTGVLGFQAERIDPAAKDSKFARGPLVRPLDRVLLRHTVGMLDPLNDGDLDHKPDRRAPRLTLSAIAQRQRLEHFKIKLSGNADRDVDRLLSIARILDASAAKAWRFTLDGNEQFNRLQDLIDLFDILKRTKLGTEMLGRLLYIEQPLSRSATFDHTANAGIEYFAPHGGLMIDEADGDATAWPRARALGYRGISVKSCKGVFRALTHRATLDTCCGEFQSGEDLTNLPIVALQQDLALMGALGLPSIERNGHHYFDGLAHLAPRLAQEASTRYPDLYEATSGGRIALKVADGRIAIRSLVRDGYGTSLTALEEGFTRREDWQPPEDLA